MKKVAIITLSGYYNLGNRLQNYALYKVLTDMGCQVSSLFSRQYERYMAKSKLRKFSEKYLHERKIDYIDPEQLEKVNGEFDYFVAGSDQIWNAQYPAVSAALPVYLMGFADPEKRISYAASFGLSQLPEAHKKTFIMGINGIPSLSVRENAGAEIVKKLCGRQAQVHVDPTLLLREEDYRVLARPDRNKPDGKYIVCNFLTEITPKHMQEVEVYAKSQGCALVDVNALLMQDRIGPEEYLDYLQGAQCVFTDSFHCCVFSALFQKAFMVYYEGVQNISSRIETLLDMLQLDNRIYVGPESLADMYNVSYENQERILEQQRKKSMSYLRNSLDIAGDQRAYVVPDKAMCCGCSACVNICPRQCITMEQDQEGFFYPQVHEEDCIHCGKCEKSCPVLQTPQKKTIPEALAAVNCREDVRQNSSSGGLFSALGQLVIKNGGVVFGACLDDNMAVHMRAAETIEQLLSLRGSKYVQAQMGNSYQQVKKFLADNRQVLFSGTPCQIAGLISFLGENPANLFTVEVVCHGVPSPAAWDDYISYRQQTCDSRAAQVNFRDKVTGWRDYSVTIHHENGSIYSSPHAMDPYFVDFLSNRNLRNSCYQCRFKLQYSQSDLTLGDLWGAEVLAPEIDDNRGVSLVFVHSQKGSDLLNQIANQLKICQVDTMTALKANIAAIMSVKKPLARASYFLNCKESAHYV